MHGPGHWGGQYKSEPLTKTQTYVIATGLSALLLGAFAAICGSVVYIGRLIVSAVLP